MEYVFLVDEGARATFLQNILHSFGCTYICLWSYVPQPSNSWLISMDGFYNEENIKRPSSSSGSHAQRLFDHYRQSVLTLENNHDRVPGLAFKNSLPYLELKGMDLQRLASLKTQLEFYQEAMIKTAVFMGSMTGEIEIGFSNDTTQVMNLEMEMTKWIPENFPNQPFLDHLPRPRPPDHQPGPSSSSSSLRSLSTDSTDPSTNFLFSIINPSTTYPQEQPPKQPPINIEQSSRPTSTTTSTSSLLLSPLHQAIQSFNQTRNNFPFLNPETEDDAITKAILVVLSSPSPSSSSQHSIAQNIPFVTSRNAGSSAFKRYGSAAAGTSSSAHSSSMAISRNAGRRPNMLKRAISYFKSLRNQERVVLQGSRPTSNQLYHMISERKRREKLNESFQALRSLLPPGTKKDKASVLNGTTEYLNSLKSQVVELTRRNQILEAQLMPHETRAVHDQQVSESSNERLLVRVTNAAETLSGARIVDLHVVVRGECNILDLVIGIVEFLKNNKRVSITSTEADTKVVNSNSTHRVELRLKIEGTDWDETAFQEAVGRVVADLAK